MKFVYRDIVRPPDSPKKSILKKNLKMEELNKLQKSVRFIRAEPYIIYSP